MKTGNELRQAMDDLRLACWSSVDWTQAPWAVMHEGREMAATTDGTLLLLIDSARVDGPLAAVPERLTRGMASWFATPCAPVTSVDGDALGRFAGVGVLVEMCDACNNEREIGCDDCDGSGRIECECDCGDCHDKDCETCNGEGSRPCKQCKGSPSKNQPATFCGFIINRMKLRAVMEIVQDTGPIAVGRIMLPGGLCAQLTGDGWIALVMCMRENTKPTAAWENPDTWHEYAIEKR